MNKSTNHHLVAIAAGLLLSSATPTIAMDQQTLNCLQNNITVEAVGFDKRIIDERKIAVRTTNNTNIDLGGVWISYEIWASDRPTPLYAASIRPAATIPGGLLPGESLTSEDYHFMEEREKAFANNTPELTIRLTVENAADVGMNGFFDHPQMASWSNTLTDATCEQRNELE